ncbi:MAG: NAD-dependent epimerase/dehydratase family protein [Anaerolineaceae bacterium]|nr:NAD-dependent epimerase/dehydratase family protein [Anaerolineaceae bacterium]
MAQQTRVLVTGGGGFIGTHLISYLKKMGYWVRGVDIKYPEFSKTDADEFELLDLRRWDNCLQATRGIDEVYGLAADMGGMGYIQSNHAVILHNNTLINFHTLEASSINGVKRYLYSSSACIYPEYLQEITDVTPLKEEDAYPADPQDEYGWEKLISERLMQRYTEEYDIKTYTVRFHNVYGPLGTWQGGREKVPAAFCRKAAVVKLSGDSVFEIWGDGKQTRSFCYIDDITYGIHKLLRSDYHKPLNMGRDRMVSINEFADLVSKIAGVEIKKKHIAGPEGVRGRNSDNTRANEVLGWSPQISLEEGIAKTYPWIEDQIKKQAADLQVDWQDLSHSKVIN